VEILLHIGQSKTGTSAIQAYLTLNRPKLAEQGVLYPAIRSAGINIDLGAHNSVADSLCGLMRFPYVTAESFFSHAFSEAERIGASKMILSAEHFFGGEPRIWNVLNQDDFFRFYRAKVESLARHLRGHRAKVLVYLRPQAHWFASAIGQTVRIQGLISDREIYESDRQFFEMAKPVLRYDSLLEIWQDALAPDSIEAVPYHKSVLRGGSIIPDFLDRAELQNIRLPYASTDLRVNESLTRECLEVKKSFNLTRPSKSAERVAIRCLVELSRERGGVTVYRPCPDVLRDLKLFVEPENAALEKRFGISAAVLNETPADPHQSPEVYDVDDAWRAFQRKFRGPRGRLMVADDMLRATLRKHAPFIHGLIHRIKMFHGRQCRRQWALGASGANREH